jgi:hydroxymethylbilane synthase
MSTSAARTRNTASVTHHFRLGTRGSALARTQSGQVADALGVPCELTVIRTFGDDTPGSLATIGGTGLFAAELRAALLEGRCDLAVHSLKDLPTAPVPGLTIAAIPARVDPSDALCASGGRRLADLPPGAKVGTGSPRRAAQLADLRPDLQIVDLRGNVDTRLARALGPDADLDAVVLAQAGLLRLGRLDVVTEVLDLVPAPGQGALAVEMRTSDLDTPLGAAVRGIDHRPSRLAVAAERALLARLEAGCSAPVGAFADLSSSGMRLTGVIGTEAGLLHQDGIADVRSEADASALGVLVAEGLLCAVP